MATIDTQKNATLETPEKTAGAYGNAATVQSGLTDTDKVWLRNLGISTADTASYQKAWATDAERYKRPTWRETYGGRVAIRAFSRGILGASFFAAGQMVERSYLANYNPMAAFNYKNPLHAAAWIIDHSLGSTIRTAARLSAGAFGKDPEKLAMRATTFRDTRQYKNYDYIKNGGPAGPGQYNYEAGRSLGHEGLGITLDFGMASLGDYAGREFANLFDPSVKKTWIKDGKVDFLGATKSFTRHVWLAVTRAMGEDYFAMAMGYPYIVRLSRKMINRYSPGFKWDSDYAANGGSNRMGLEKQPNEIYHARIVGNYQLEGMTDLGFRFTIYNWYTKMYRDFYDWMADVIDKARNKTLRVNLPTVTDAIAGSVNYLLRTAIKMTTIMVPSTFFFYITRSPQSKDIGLAIHPTRGPIGALALDKETGKTRFHAVHADGTIASRRSSRDQIREQAVQDGRYLKESGTQKGNEKYLHFQQDQRLPEDRRLYFKDPYQPEFRSRVKVEGEDYHMGSEYYGAENKDKYKFQSGRDLQNGAYYERRYDPFSKRNNSDSLYGSSLQGKKYVVWHDLITNPIGKLCHTVSDWTTETLKYPLHNVGMNGAEIATFCRRFIYASISYTPYFAAKTDLLTFRLDTPRNDMAIDRTLSGIAHFNIGEIRAGCSEMWNTLWGRPFADMKRERVAQAKMSVHKNQLWGEPEELKASLEAEETITSGFARKPFATEDLRKKPLTQLEQRREDADVRPRSTSYREELMNNLSTMQVQGHG